MKIKKEDKVKLDKKIRRDSQLDAVNNGMDLRSKPYKNKKKYSRKIKNKNEKNNIIGFISYKYMFRTKT